MGSEFYSKLYNPFGGVVVHFQEIGSTMDAAHAQIMPGSLFITEHQTAGKGRLLGRQWQDQKGQNLLFTLVLSQEFWQNKPVPLLTALALAKLLHKYSISAQVKWPNDVLVKDKKIAGILAQMHQDLLLLGIGINVNQDDFSQMDKAATSFKIVVGQPMDKEQILADFLLVLHGTFTEISHWNRDLNHMLWRRGQVVDYYMDLEMQQKITGEIVAVQEDGGLKILTQDGPQILYSGEGVIRENKGDL